MSDLTGIDEELGYGGTLCVEQSPGSGEIKGKDSRKIIDHHVSETKTVSYLKSHSEAERRRRDRINSHLESLRTLVPSTDKMDKATLLGEVISQVKQLKTKASRASESMHIPMDTDAVEIIVLEDDIQASVCCKYTQDLMSNIKQCIDGLPVQVLSSEISTLGGRVKSVFLITCDSRNNVGKYTVQECIVSQLRRMLTNILDKVSASMECDQLVFPQKKQRLSS